MSRLIPLWAVLFLGTAAAAAGEENLVRNPSFEQDVDGDGTPDQWRAAGDRRLVEQTLEVFERPDGGRCGRLRCTQFRAGNPAAHAMLCQMGVPVRRGIVYRVAFKARGENIASDVVSLALSDTSAWANCGLDVSFAPTPEWNDYEFLFRAERDCASESRLQFWFASTGTLWLDDVVVEETRGGLYRPGHVLSAQGVKNLVPNASFECGADGWGSTEWDRTTHWGGAMNQLFGQIDHREALEGQASLRVELTPENRPVSYFDYYDLHRTPIRSPLAANIGFLEVEPGTEYTLSAYLKAAEPGTPALLAVRQFEGRSFDKTIRVSTEWERYEFQFKPTSRWCYVLAGPDLRETQRGPNPPDRAVLWIDAIQLERGPSPSPFRPRRPVELGIWTEKTGEVFDWSEPLRFHLKVARSSSADEQPLSVRLRLTDFFDDEVWSQTVKREPGDAETVLTVEPQTSLRGFLRLHARPAAGDDAERSLRLAVIPIHRADDSRFGVNHAYPWPHLLDLCRKAGLVWVRDWSLKWQEVEPEQGCFTFAETDHQINRPLEHDLRVLGLLPFPSAHWSSSAPADYRLTEGYQSRREHVAYAPSGEEAFENYVERTVKHYRDRIGWWQVFNEPVFTTYSLPRQFGYSGADYARWVKTFARAARRADPNCRILAGIGALQAGRIMDDFEQFFAAGGLEAVDAIDIHHYPRVRPPEFAEELLDELGALMEKHGGRKPLWLTEYGYYADDDPWATPMPHNGFNQPLESESLQAAYAVRWMVLMLAGGVEKIFYHAGTCDGVNRDSLQGIFFEHAGRPHKIYAAQAVMAHLFTPTCRFVRRLAEADGGVRAYWFRDGRRQVAVVWAPSGAEPRALRVTDSRVEIWDLMGRPQARPDVTPSATPVFLVADGLPAEDFERALGPPSGH